MRRDFRIGPRRSAVRGECRDGGVEIAHHLVRDPYRAVRIRALDAHMEKRRRADPGLVLDLDRVVAQRDDEVRAAQEAALNLAPRPLDAAERQRVVLADEPLRHRGGCERHAPPVDEAPQQARISHPHRGGADHGDGSLGGGDEARGFAQRVVRRRR
jgi:hypothetical protein